MTITSEGCSQKVSLIRRSLASSFAPGALSCFPVASAWQNLFTTTLGAYAWPILVCACNKIPEKRTATVICIRGLLLGMVLTLLRCFSMGTSPKDPGPFDREVERMFSFSV